VSVDNAWWVALTTAHTDALKRQNDHYREQPMDSDDGKDE